MSYVYKTSGPTSAPPAFLCNCVGPQPGMPRCPCQMRGLIQRDGRWIQPEVDLGPVLALPGQNFWRD
jgi:hypothetical protein